ncbi:Splicing factor U2af large subunit A, partial [Ophiophagus hannah]
MRERGREGQEREEEREGRREERKRGKRGKEGRREKGGREGEEREGGREKGRRERRERGEEGGREREGGRREREGGRKRREREGREREGGRQGEREKTETHRERQRHTERETETGRKESTGVCVRASWHSLLPFFAPLLLLPSFLPSTRACIARFSSMKPTAATTSQNDLKERPKQKSRILGSLPFSGGILLVWPGSNEPVVKNSTGLVKQVVKKCYWFARTGISDNQLGDDQLCLVGKKWGAGSAVRPSHAPFLLPGGFPEAQCCKRGENHTATPTQSHDHLATPTEPLLGLNRRQEIDGVGRASQRWHLPVLRTKPAEYDLLNHLHFPHLPSPTSVLCQVWTISNFGPLLPSHPVERQREAERDRDREIDICAEQNSALAIGRASSQEEGRDRETQRDRDKEIDICAEQKSALATGRASASKHSAPFNSTCPDSTSPDSTSQGIMGSLKDDDDDKEPWWCRLLIT